MPAKSMSRSTDGSSARGMLLVTGLRGDDGRREILGVSVVDTESEATYQELFRALKARGLIGVQPGYDACMCDDTRNAALRRDPAPLPRSSIVWRLCRADSHGHVCPNGWSDCDRRHGLA